MDCQEKKPDYFKLLDFYAKKNAIPVGAAFELTPLCNFRCPMCYVRLSPEEAEQGGGLLGAEQWLDFGRQAAAMGTLRLTVTGGEAMTHPAFWKIWAGLSQMGFLLSLLSNGSLIDEEAMAKFREFGLPSAVKLSLYATSDEKYESFCGVKDGFTRIDRAIDLLKAERIPLQMTATVVKENKEEMPLMYAYAEKKQVPFFHTIAVAKSTRGVSNHPEESRLMPADFTEEYTLEGLENNKRPRMPFPYAVCGQYRRSFWLGWNGEMLGCSFARVPRTDALHQPLEAAWKQLLQLQEAVQEPSECKNCQHFAFCRKCPGVLSAETGDPQKVSPTLCDEAEKMHKLYTKLKGERL